MTETEAGWKAPPKKVTGLYESELLCRSILSKAGHVKSCLNLGGPPSKAKYEQMTDSAEVP